MAARNILTLAQKSDIRRHRHANPSLPFDHLHSWAESLYGHIAKTTLSEIINSPEVLPHNPFAKRVANVEHPEMEAEVHAEAQRRKNAGEPELSNSQLWALANAILLRMHGEQKEVSSSWPARFKKRQGLLASQAPNKRVRYEPHDVETEEASLKAGIAMLKTQVNTLMAEKNDVEAMRNDFEAMRNAFEAMRIELNTLKVEVATKATSEVAEFVELNHSRRSSSRIVTPSPTSKTPSKTQRGSTSHQEMKSEE